MDTLFLLIAAAITLVALDVGDEARRRKMRERRLNPLPALARLPDEQIAPAGAPERFRPGADPWTGS